MASEMFFFSNYIVICSFKELVISHPGFVNIFEQCIIVIKHCHLALPVQENITDKKHCNFTELDMRQ